MPNKTNPVMHIFVTMFMIYILDGIILSLIKFSSSSISLLLEYECYLLSKGLGGAETEIAQDIMTSFSKI